jgi:hypothetical protein
MFKTFVTISLLFLCQSSFANFDQNFEYRSLSEDERKLKNQWSKIDSEYAHDILGSMFSDYEESLWRTQRVMFMQSAASISGKQFAFDQRIKLDVDLIENLQFKVLHFQQGDYEHDQDHNIFEFKYKSQLDIDFSFYFELAHLKKENDFGLAATLHPSNDHSIRIFHSWTDAERNLRNEDADRFNSMPQVYGIKGNLTRSGIETEYGILIEPEFRWAFPVEGREYTYRRYMANLFLNIPLRGNFLSLRTQWDSKLDVDTIRTEENRFQTLVRHHWVNQDTGLEYKVGILLARRNWSYPTHDVTMFDGIPHFGVMWPKKKTINNSRWGFEYGGTLHQQTGDFTQSTNNTNFIKQNRLDAIWEWTFNPKALFIFRAGVDLDDFGTPDTWQSGVGRFVMYF